MTNIPSRIMAFQRNPAGYTLGRFASRAATPAQRIRSIRFLAVGDADEM
jgi:hypothetical protein